ncbi:MAG: TRAP transporter small permease [Syntrophorhabdaceae bacterium]|nr:TRAP transporter small permease [Syntrophorhabdaceae bacterium]MDD4195787.1 TRAP transporter small permease [Syntrophorhabdaceae bacterium]HOC46190.1 TRAP transporter small permease [Syntrophorhabdaceae bacterium]
MKYLERFNTALNGLLMVIGGFAVLALMTVATTNVVLRMVHAPYRGAYEVVSFLGAVVIAFALGYTEKHKGNIVVDILTEKFPKIARDTLEGFNYVVSGIFFVFVSWQVYECGMKIMQSGELSETLKIVYHPFVFAVSFGFAALALTLFIDLLKLVLRAEVR